jgi:hypothetical protein
MPVYCSDIVLPRKLRELYAIDAADYMLSLCSDAALRQLNRWVGGAQQPE